MNTTRSIKHFKIIKHLGEGFQSFRSVVTILSHNYMRSKCLIILFLLLSFEAKAFGDDYREYYFKGIFEVETSQMTHANSIKFTSKTNRYFVIYDDKIFTTLNNSYSYVDQDLVVKDGSYHLVTEMGTEFDIKVKNGKISEFQFNGKIKENKIKKTGCFFATFIHRFNYLYKVISYEGLFGTDEKKKVWKNDSLRVYEIFNEAGEYTSYNLNILNNDLAIEWDGESGFYDRVKEQDQTNNVSCYQKKDIGTNEKNTENALIYVKNEKKKKISCYIEVKNCRVFNGNNY
jgi:hypothetical protein